MTNLEPTHKNVIKERLALLNARRESIAERSSNRVFLFLLPLMWMAGVALGSMFESIDYQAFISLFFAVVTSDLIFHMNNKKKEGHNAIFFPRRTVTLLAVTAFVFFIYKESSTEFSVYTVILSIYGLYLGNAVAFGLVKNSLFSYYKKRYDDIDELIVGLTEVDDKTHRLLKDETSHPEAVRYINNIEAQGRNMTFNEHDLVSSFNYTAEQQSINDVKSKNMASTPLQAV